MQSEGPADALKGATDPEVADDGKGIDDFSRSGVYQSVRKALSLLPRNRRRGFALVAAIQISLGLLDLLGIALVGLVAAIAVTGVEATTLPAPIARGVDFLGLGEFTISQLSVIVALAAVLILVAKTVISAILSRYIVIFLANSQALLAVRLARELLSRPLVVVQRWTTSEASYALGAGTGAATVALLGSSITIASEVFLFSIVGISLFLFDPVLTLTSMIFFSVIVFVLHRILGRWAARTSAVIRDASIATLTLVTEALSTFRETSVLNRRDLYVERFSELTMRNARAGALSSYILEVPKYVLEVALYMGVLLLAVVQFVTKDWAAAAATTALFLAAGSRLIPALLRLQGAGITIRNASVSAQPTFYLADYLAGLNGSNPEYDRGPRVSARDLEQRIARGYEDFAADLQVQEVFFTYAGAREPALKDITFSVPEGASVALVGSTGAGKSTLADILIGALEPESGSVRIGGLTPREAISAWSGAISYVPQAVSLTIGTVRENVALGFPDEFIDDDLVLNALKRAHLADFLKSHRDGIHTNVGERGFRLSGGQRQRLGIARALYTRPKLLVLDEATSALDAETETAIVAALNELEGHVTTITVAHRLATVRRADLLIYLKNGESAAMGSFDEVRAQVSDFDRQASLMGL